MKMKVFNLILLGMLIAFVFSGCTSMTSVNDEPVKYQPGDLSFDAQNNGNEVANLMPLRDQCVPKCGDGLCNEYPKCQGVDCWCPESVETCAEDCE